MSPDGVVRVVLTGGPCAGKTTALARLRAELGARGWRVVSVPEAASLVITHAVPELATWALTDRRRYQRAQEHLLGLQVLLEDQYLGLARLTHEGRTVLICDRGILDSGAYLTPEELTEALGSIGLTRGEALERYDAVLCLTSAAVEAPEAYTLSTNEARSEGLELAQLLDAATARAWLGHPHLGVVTSSEGFEAKLEQCVESMLGVLGDPEPIEIERKYLVAEPPARGELTSRAVPVGIVQDYLVSKTGRERVRRREVFGRAAYYHTIKHARAGELGRTEVERLVTEEEYEELLTRRDPRRVTVSKTRWCFTENGQHFELDEFHAPVQAWLLEAELSRETQAVRVPEWLGETQDVTDDPAWSNASLAKSLRRAAQ